MALANSYSRGTIVDPVAETSFSLGTVTRERTTLAMGLWSANVALTKSASTVIASPFGIINSNPLCWGSSMAEQALCKR